MDALERQEKHLEFGDIGFCVDFAYDKPCISVLPFPFDIPNDSASDASASGSDAHQRMLLSKARHQGSTLIEIKVPIGGEGNTETLMCLGEVKQYQGSIVERPGQSKKAFDELRAGIDAGGSPRDASLDDDFSELDACYDEIDELIRRLRVESEILKQPLFDAELIAAVVDRYLLEVDDSTPVRFS